MKDEVAGGGRRRVGAPHPPASPHARARSPSGSGAASPPPSPPGSSYSQAGVRGGQQPGGGRFIKRGGMEPGEGRRRGSGSGGGNARRAGGEEEAAGRRAARLLAPAPLRCSRGTAASAGPPPRGLPSPSPAAAPLHRAAARIPARLYPPAPGSEKADTRGPRPGWGSWVPARRPPACLPPTPPPLPDEPRWPPGFLRAEPSSDMNRKGPPPARGGRRRRLVARGGARALREAGGPAAGPGRAGLFLAWCPGPRRRGRWEPCPVPRAQLCRPSPAGAAPGRRGAACWGVSERGPRGAPLRRGRA
ncbi:translation initiation factor IF-2-like [Falco rusticolus]|uniref:translation initiation factor IF-2-like n=1 Tax=Falco rusticolus TaxID=120794 RepID=UPI0018866AA1|nr:translation initiation factor IF-2-like [Falco rusticolus]XP_037251443.1 translation initiation factor IF-2-like [Falco rusticolus]XP_037251444.1 translation initiation factor IF-2-like [Falco rusticolus]XP_037251445.1 translation initiation factor IF-2-like [Falco rusticolus]XP_037251446.1 translation initiation factor IF-2-like [Falco rusticolus]XP_037251447.1 translation initiation factor IF-2-like [Falco rusticolus]XP_055573291.1 translation initiation factor IF-2-like [Falco cherrug]